MKFDARPRNHPLAIARSGKLEGSDAYVQRAALR
jgi:hypothetical protein